MKLSVIYDKSALKREGDESTIYCSICNSELRLGIYRTLFCSKCEIVGSFEVKIDSIMSCVHCSQPLTVKRNYDGRITGRCENENCGDCWSMQDLCLITLNKSIMPEIGEDPYIRYISNTHEAEMISNEWIDAKTLGFCELKQEILDYLSKISPNLVRAKSSLIFINQALVNAIELNYWKLKNMDTRNNRWHSVSNLIRESGVKREIVVAIIEKFTQEGCSYETRFYIRQRGKSRFIHSNIYGWIMEQIKNIKDENNLAK